MTSERNCSGSCPHRFLLWQTASARLRSCNALSSSSSSCSARLDSDKNPCFFPKSVGSQVQTRTSHFSFGAHGQCGVLSAVAELVAATLIFTSVFGFRRARAKMRKKTWLRAMVHLMASGKCRYRGRGYKGPSDAVQLAPEDTLARVHDSLVRNSLGHKWWPGWRPVPETNVEKFPSEPRRHRRRG